MEYDEGRMMTCRRPLDVVMGKNYSIYNQCRECCGWEADPAVGGTLADEVARCTATECPLWPHRLPKSQIRRFNERKAQIRDQQNEGIGLGTPIPAEAVLAPENDSEATLGRSKAINLFCKSCMCTEDKRDLTAIKECVSDQCWLYPHRAGVGS
jgi:hypothetical protein